jgi:3-methyladenine DNA glycosylase AlkD
MPTLKSVMSELQSKGTEQTRKTYARHGMAKEHVIGVSSADMKLIAKSIKGQQDLAYELYATGMMEAMYLAAMVANGAKMTPDQLQAWAMKSAGLAMVFEHAVPWVAVENPVGRQLALDWVESDKEHMAACGWKTYAGLLVTRADADLDLEEVTALLDKAVAGIGVGAERARYCKNGFVISVGTHVKPLYERARAAAEAIGTVAIDVGDTACKVPNASAAIEKASAAGQLGKKKKTIRC